MFQKTPLVRVLFPRAMTPVLVGGFLAFLVLFSTFFSLVGVPRAHAATSTNNTLNFQARLQTASGAIVPDGFYNVQFKLYDGDTAGGSAGKGVGFAGSNLWTETYYDSNGVTAGNDNRVRVANGYLTVNLGSQTPFPSTINWDQRLWLTMNIGGVTQTATPTYDGEMNPRLSLTGVPYAFRAGQLAAYNSTSDLTSTLSILQPTGGSQVFQIADQAAAGTYTMCVQGATSAKGGCAPTTGGSGYIQNQNTSQQSGSNFWMSGTGRADTALQAPSFDAPTAVALSIGTTNATSITLGKSGVNTFVGGNLSVGTAQSLGAITIANGAWFTSVDAAGTGSVNMFQVNSSNQIQIGAALNVDGGIVLPTDGGQMTLVDLGVDAAASSGSKQSYTFRVGSTNALTVYGESDGAGNTQNVRVAVGSSIAPAYTLDVGGDINTTGVYRINGQQICSTSGCTTSGSAGGDLSGTYPNPGVAKIQGTALNISSPVAGNILIWNGSGWTNTAANGDITISSTGLATISANSVTLGTDTTGNYVAGVTAGTGISITGTAGEGWSPTVAVSSDVCRISAGNCTGANSGGVTGTGTLNTIAMFTASGAIGNSILSQNGTTIDITGNIQGTNANFNTIQTNGTTRLDVSGNLSSIGTITASGAVSAGTYNTNTFNGNTLTFGNNAAATTIQSGTNQDLNIIGNGSGSLNLGATTGTNAINLGLSSGTDTINIATGSGNDAVNILTGAGTNTLTVGTASTTTTINGAIKVTDLNSIKTNIPANDVVNNDPTSLAQSPIPASLWHDLFAFDKYATPTFEQFNGTSWNAASLDNSLFAQKQNQNIVVLDGSATTAARWTWNSPTFSFSTGTWLNIGFSYRNPSATKTILFESSADGTTWTTRHVSTGNTQNANPAWFYVSSYGGDPYLRLTITGTTAGSVGLSTIKLMSNRWGDQGGGSELSYPYTWDGSQNMTTGGTLTTTGNLTVNGSGNLFVGGQNVITSARVLQNVTANANILTSGTIASGLLTGQYTGITGVGTLTTGTWTASVIADAYINDALTVSSAGNVAWTALSAYPAACSAGQAITALNDAPTCSTFATTDTNTTYSASGDVNLVGTTFSLQPTLNNVTTINRTSSNLTLQTTTSGNIVLNSAGTIELQDNTNVTGNLGVTGNIDVSGSVSSKQNAVRTYQNLYSWGTTTPSVTGTMEIILPNAWNSTMLRFQLSGYDYSSKAAWQAIVSGYNYSTTSSWNNTSAEIRGAPAPFSSVRLAYDTVAGKTVLLLGTTGTVWNYPQVSIDELVAGYSNVDAWGSGYSSAFLTSEANITTIVSPATQLVAYTSTSFQQGGNSFGAAAVLGTNDSQTLSLKTANANRVTIDTSGNVNLLTGGLQVAGSTILTSGKVLQNVLGYTQSSGSATFNQNAADQFKILALQAPTTDMALISNSGFPITTAGINAQQIDYYAALNTAAAEAASSRINITNTSATASTVTDGIRLVVSSNTSTGTTNAIKIDNITGGSGTENAINLGTGYDNLLTYNNGTSLINGAGVLQSAGISGAYGNLTGTGALASGSIASGFGTISTSNTITGTTLNGTTGINTGAGAGTQRIDSSGNLTNIGNATLSGGVNAKGYATTNTSSTFSGQWTKLGSCTISSQFQDCRSQASIVAVADGGSMDRAMVDIRVKQQNALGGVPYVSVIMDGASGITTSDITAVTTVNTASSTVVELWGRLNSTFRVWNISPIINTTGGGQQFAWVANQGFSVSLPAGTTTTPTYGAITTTTVTASNNINTTGGNYQLNGISVITAGGVLQNVTANANILTTGILSATVISGSYTGITGVGTLTVGTWNADTIGVAYGGTGINGAAAANGTLLIGNGSGYTLATLTAGTGIGINNTAGGITISNTGTAGAAGGDLTGTYPNPTIAKLQGGTLTISSVATDNILQYNGSAWVNRTISGDITLAGGIAAIGASKVTSTMILDGTVSGTDIANNTITNADILAGSFGNITGVGTLGSLSVSGVITSTIATGTAPLTVTSTTVVANLNADMVDGLHASSFAAASGSANYIQNKTGSPQTTSNFWISGNGVADSALLTPRLDTNTNVALAIGNTSQTGITIGRTSGTTNYVNTISGTTVLKNNADSTTAFQIQNAAGTSYFTADSVNQRASINNIYVGSPANVSLVGRSFSTSFEQGSIYDFADAGGLNVNIDSSISHNGQYSAQIQTSGSYAYLETPVATTSTIYGRTYFNVSTLGSPTVLTDFGTDAINKGNHLYIYLGASGFLCYSSNLNGAAGTCSTTAPSTGAWHKLETEVVVNGASGALQVYLDNTLVTTGSPGVNLPTANFGTTPIDNFSLGNSTGSTATVNFDDVAVDTVPTGDSSSVYVADTLHVGGSTDVGYLTLNSSNGNGDSLTANGSINAGGFSVYGDAGMSSSCTNGQSLTNTTVEGGVITSGTCANAVSTLQDAYNNTSQSTGGSTSTPQLVPGHQTANSSTTAASSITTTIPASTAGNLMVALIGTGLSSGIPSVTSVTGGGTWKRATVGDGSNTYTHIEMWYCYTCVSTTSVIVNTSSSSIFTVNISEYSGIQTSSDPLEVATGGGAATGSNIQTSPSITTNGAHDLLLAGMTYSGSIATSAPMSSGWSALTSSSANAKQEFPGYQANVGAGTYNAVWTINPSSITVRAGMVIGGFKANTSGGSTVASILLSDAKDYIITAPDTATDPNVLVNLQCRTGCSTSQGRWAVQSNGTDALSVLYDTATSITNVRIQTGVDIKLAADSVGAPSVHSALTHDFVCTSTEQVYDLIVIDTTGKAARYANATPSGTVGGVVVAKPNTTTCTVAFSGIVQVWAGGNSVVIGDSIQNSPTAGAAVANIPTPGGQNSIGNAISGKDGNNLFWALLH